MAYEIERTARRGRDHGDAAGHRLLHGLTERLMRPGVREDVQRGEDPGEFVPGAAAEEDGTGQRAAQRGRARPVPRDHDAYAVQRADVREELHLLLGASRPT